LELGGLLLGTTLLTYDFGVSPWFIQDMFLDLVTSLASFLFFKGYICNKLALKKM